MARKGPKPKPLKERFESKFIVDESGCWNWQAAIHNGYGMFSITRRKMIGAHRASWNIYRGTIIDSQHVLHSCDNKACVNPDHLYLGDQDQNNKDSWERGQQYVRAKKITNPEKIIPAIRASTRLLREDAETYGLSVGMISMIRNRKVWKHI